MKLNKRQLLCAAAAAFMAAGGALAQTKEVTFAHQDMLVPLRTEMESGEIGRAHV